MATQHRNVNGRVHRSTKRRGQVSSPTSVSLATGLSLWHGDVREEYLSELKPWSRAVKVYQEMQDDVVIGALFEAIKTPLLASPFEVMAASDAEEDVLAKEFVEENLFNMPNLEWTKHVEEMLEFLDMGWALSEKVLEKRKDGLMYLRTLIPIGQETLYRWGEVDELGQIKSFQQRDRHGAIRTAEIDKLLHFTFRGRQRNPQGRGILRSLYRPWFFKKNLETLEAIGVERDVGNAPVVTLKEGVRYSGDDITKLEAALSGFRMDENLYVILPGGAELTAYGGGNKVYNIREVIRDWQHLIRQRFFADFISLGSEAVGTQALADEMTTFFGLALRSIQEMMLAIWNRQLIPWLFEWNNLEPEKLPKLEWLRPHDMNLQSLAQAYNTLVGANMLDPNDTELRNRVRAQLGLRPLEGPLQIDTEVGGEEIGEVEDDNLELMEAIEVAGKFEIQPYKFARSVASIGGAVALGPDESIRQNPDEATQSRAGRSIPDEEKFVAIFRNEKGQGMGVFIRAKTQQIALEAGRKMEASIASRLPGGKFARLLDNNNNTLWQSPEEEQARADKAASAKGEPRRKGKVTIDRELGAQISKGKAVIASRPSTAFRRGARTGALRGPAGGISAVAGQGFGKLKDLFGR